MKKLILILLYILGIAITPLLGISINTAAVLLGAGIVFVAVDVLFYLMTFKKRQYQAIMEKAEEFTMNKRFVDRSYKQAKFNVKMSKMSLKAIKKTAKKEAADTIFNIGTQINQAKKAGNKVSFKTMLEATKFNGFLLYRANVKQARVTYKVK